MPNAYSYLRFSTADQIHGDSTRRQTELARDGQGDQDSLHDLRIGLVDLGREGIEGRCDDTAPVPQLL